MKSKPTHYAVSRAARYVLAFPERLQVDHADERRRMRAVLSEHGRMVHVAALREIARPSPSWPEVGALVGCAHSTAMADWERWSVMPWRDRANWLDLLERVADTLAEHDEERKAKHGANVDVRTSD
jgi:hypothetical protein